MALVHHVPVYFFHVVHPEDVGARVNISPERTANCTAEFDDLLKTSRLNALVVGMCDPVLALPAGT